MHAFLRRTAYPVVLRSAGFNTSAYSSARNLVNPKLTIPIVGRPNVGKSTLFNRLVRSRDRQRASIVSPFPGTTRDRREGRANLVGAEFVAVDTGGLEEDDDASVYDQTSLLTASANGSLNQAIAAQVAAAVAGSELALFVVDAREGVTPMDRHFALWCRKQPGGEERRWIVLLNKAEGIMARAEDGNDEAMAELAADVERLGLGDQMCLVSARDGDGFAELATLLLPDLEPREPPPFTALGGVGETEEGASGANALGRDENENVDTASVDGGGGGGAMFGDSVHREGDNDFRALFEDVELEEAEELAAREECEDGGTAAAAAGVETPGLSASSLQTQLMQPVELAIVGRPNVGKSSIVNALLKSPRMVVGPLPGVTRDAIPVDWEWGGRPLRLVDTAGIRKFNVGKKALKGGASTAKPTTTPWSASASHIASPSPAASASAAASGHGGSDDASAARLLFNKQLQRQRQLSHRSSGGAVIAGLDFNAELALEQQAVNASLRSLGLASVVVLVVDASALRLRSLELSLAGKILGEGRALVIAANKADLMDGSGSSKSSLAAFRAGVAAQCAQMLPQQGALPVVALSAKTGAGVGRLLPSVVDAHDRWCHRVPTGILNRWLKALERHHPPPRANKSSGGGFRTQVKLKYMTQLKGRPPTFAVWCNRSEGLRQDYIAFLRNNLRDEFGFQGIPMRLLLRSTSTSLHDRLKAKNNKAGAAAKAAATKRSGRSEHSSDLVFTDEEAPREQHDLQSRRSRGRVDFGEGVSVTVSPASLSPPSSLRGLYEKKLPVKERKDVQMGNNKEEVGEKEAQAQESWPDMDGVSPAELRLKLQKKQQLALLKRRNVKGRRQVLMRK